MVNYFLISIYNASKHMHATNIRISEVQLHITCKASKYAADFKGNDVKCLEKPEYPNTESRMYKFTINVKYCLGRIFPSSRNLITDNSNSNKMLTNILLSHLPKAINQANIMLFRRLKIFFFFISKKTEKYMVSSMKYKIQYLSHLVHQQ